MRHDWGIVPFRLGNLGRCKCMVADPKKRASCDKGELAFSLNIFAGLARLLPVDAIPDMGQRHLAKKTLEGFPCIDLYGC